VELADIANRRIQNGPIGGWPEPDAPMDSPLGPINEPGKRDIWREFTNATDNFRIRQV
jgi:hypothetical protein